MWFLGIALVVGIVAIARVAHGSEKVKKMSTASFAPDYIPSMSDAPPASQLSARSEAFVPDGKRRQISASDAKALWLKYTDKIPWSFGAGSGKHESNFTYNEVDTEKSGFQSFGIYQLSKNEAKEAGESSGNLFDPETNTYIFVNRSLYRLKKILSAAKLDSPTSDVWPYLFIAHNQGLEAAIKSINDYGLDWSAYKKRNASHTDWIAYGDDVQTGGGYA